VSRAARLAYAVLAVADTALAASSDPAAARARRVTKPLLMPALMAGRSGPTRRALGLSGAGDVALLGKTDAAFTAGLGAFLAGQLAWVKALRGRRGPHAGLLGRHPVVAVPYVAAAVGLNAYLWRRALARRPTTDAAKELAPVAVYSAALTAMALAAADTGEPLTAAGGALFLASDGLIALERFGGVSLPAHDAWVMGTYTAAQGLLARE
jgi:uncharacterized membrane protein YhhN